jgi:hypothetical protein
MNIEDIIRDINSEKFVDIYDASNYLENEYLGKRVAINLDVDKHRWYELSTTVYAIDDIYIGLRGISDIYSETMDYDGLDYVKAFEMEPVQSITYKAK